MDGRQPPGRVGQWIIRVIRAAGWHRRLLAGGLAAAAMALALHVAEPPARPTVPAVVAARDLPGGATLADGDLDLAETLPGTLPTGALPTLEAGAGRQLAGPVRAGEIITDVRLVGAALLDGWGDELAAVPVRIADPGVTTLLRPGDRVDLLAAPMSGVGEAVVLASRVPVLTMPPAGDGGLLADGALVVVAATPAQAAALAQAAIASRLSVALRR